MAVLLDSNVEEHDKLANMPTSAQHNKKLSST